MRPICITNATIVTMDERTPLVENGAVLVADGRIQAIGPAALTASHPDAELVDAGGGIVMPGMLCTHTHLYSAFARGMALPGDPPRNFKEILERLWWRLDLLLTPEDIASSAEVGLVDAIRHGVTTLVDHHASPSFADGSLDVIAAAVEASGLRACLAYEVSERNGATSAEAGLRENERFIRAIRPTAAARDGRLAAAVGLHASFTVGVETLSACADLSAAQGVGCHVHVAEDLVDQDDCQRRHSTRVVPHLIEQGVLGPGSLAAHCVHVDGFEIAELARAGVAVAHNPRSNMGNAVGSAPVAALSQAGVVVGLGTDGVSMNMFEEMRAAQAQARLAAQDPRPMPSDRVLALAFGGGGRICDSLFSPFAPGLGPLGQLRAGGPADLVILDYAPPTPLTPDSASSHLVSGADGGCVTDTMVAGRWLMRQRELVSLDQAQIVARSREQAQALWRRAVSA
ncbi:MAG: putative aminohydrolase SsnA [Candidatus Dormibacteria bacterium]